jgi:hypothetical protein
MDNQKELISYNRYEKINLLEQLKELSLEEKSTVFHKIIYNEEQKQYRSLYWNDIIKAIYDYYDINYYVPSRSSKYLSFFSEEDFKKLENLGLDYNYQDRAGLNFLHFFMNASLSTRFEREDYIFATHMTPYVISKTENIYHLTHSKEHILFEMMNVNSAGIHGEKFDAFVKPYSFNLSQKNTKGLNLVDIALQNHLSTLAFKLIHDYQVDYQHCNEKGQNILRHFLFLWTDKETLKLFEALIPNLNANHVIEEKGLIDTWLDWSKKDANVNDDNKNQCVKWIIYLAQLMQEDRLKIDYNHPNIPNLAQKIELLTDEFVGLYQYKYKNLANIFEQTHSLMTKKYLETHMENKEFKVGTKLKI